MLLEDDATGLYDVPEVPVETTWRGAIDKAKRELWAGLRTSGVIYSQVTQMALLVSRITTNRTRAAWCPEEDLLDQPISTSTPADIALAIQQCTAKGLAPATVHKRMVYLKVIGANTAGTSNPPKRRVLKWWLRREKEEELLEALLRAPLSEDHANMARLIVWTTRTGLRIEESLSLETHHIGGEHGDEVTVPGTKTFDAQATITIHPFAAAIARGAVPGPRERVYAKVTLTNRVFPLEYPQARDMWQECRRMLGATDIPTATLKSLRRSAARYLHTERNMPLDMVRDYLRHNSVATTEGYLRLTGGYALADQRRFFSASPSRSQSPFGRNPH